MRKDEEKYLIKNECLQGIKSRSEIKWGNNFFYYAIKF